MIMGRRRAAVPGFSTGGSVLTRLLLLLPIPVREGGFFDAGSSAWSAPAPAPGAGWGFCTGGVSSGFLRPPSADPWTVGLIATRCLKPTAMSMLMSKEQNHAIAIFVLVLIIGMRYRYTGPAT